jgi:hypothetical protein
MGTCECLGCVLFCFCFLCCTVYFGGNFSSEIVCMCECLVGPHQPSFGILCALPHITEMPVMTRGGGVQAAREQGHSRCVPSKVLWRSSQRR